MATIFGEVAVGEKVVVDVGGLHYIALTKISVDQGQTADSRVIGVSHWTQVVTGITVEESTTRIKTKLIRHSNGHYSLEIKRGSQWGLMSPRQKESLRMLADWQLREMGYEPHHITMALCS